jgi:predicted acetyltransferase
VTPDATLVPVEEEDKPVVANLLQLYRYDMSEFREYDVSEHGLFVYRFLDHYWTEPGRHAFLIRRGSVLIGFAMVREVGPNSYDVAEFFVLRRHRGSGAARTAAHEMFCRFAGRWTLFHDDANTRAGRFWTAVVTEVSEGTFDREAIVSSAGFAGQRLRFEVPAKDS